MSSLGSLYEQGHGVAKDFVQAYAWYTRASKDDGEYDQDVFDRAKRACEELAKRMTPVQVEEARKLAASSKL